MCGAGVVSIALAMAVVVGRTLSCAPASNGAFHSQWTISPLTGEIATQRGEATPSATHMGSRGARKGARQPFAGPALVAGRVFDIGHERADAGLGLIGGERFEGFPGDVPALGEARGTGQRIGAFDAAGVAVHQIAHSL